MSLLHPYTFFFDLPLYTSIDINSDNVSELHYLGSANYKIEAYNPLLKQETTYSVSKNYGTIYTRQPTVGDYEGYHQFDIKCVRNGYTIRTYLAVLCDEMDEGEHHFAILKVGQFPSIADLHISKVKNYDKVLEKEKIKEK